MRKTLLLASIATILTLCLVSIPAQADTNAAGTCQTPAAITPSIFISVNGSTSFTKFVQVDGSVNYVASGTCMRNWGKGTITIQGVPNGFLNWQLWLPTPLVRVALLYWSVLNATYSPQLSMGKFNGVPITGTLLGKDTSPCWASPYVYSFRADVTNLILPGINGQYKLTDFASGRTDGANPWAVDPTPPGLEGASLIIIYNDINLCAVKHSVMVYDGPPVTFVFSTVNTTITGFSVGRTCDVKTTFIISDGQIAIVGAGTKTAWLQSPSVINLGTAFDGQDVVDSTGSRNTVTGWLHDTTTFNIWQGLPVGTGTATLAVSTGSDCLTWLAQVFSVPIN